MIGEAQYIFRFTREPGKRWDFVLWRWAISWVYRPTETELSIRHRRPRA